MSVSPLEGRKVLVVEDETIVSFMIEHVLADFGCQSIWIAASIGEALEILRTCQPDIAILDVNVGGELVFPVAERLKAAGIPFIFTTGYGRGGLLNTWLRYPVVNKPYDVDMLLAALNAALAESGALRLNRAGSAPEKT